MNVIPSNGTRRRFLAVTAALAASSLLPSSSLLEAQASTNEIPEQAIAHDPRRPQFHLLPARNWMNDPNGPIFANGKYHMFFQFNPFGAVWGNMSWNHAVSPDMLHWTHLPLALEPTPDSADSFGCFSGSALQVNHRVYQVYTGTKLSSRALATIRDGEDKIQESQCLAWSDDQALERWSKLPQPIIPLPPKGMKVTGFRDPSVWKQGEWFYMTVGSGEAEVGGCVLLYRSQTLGDAAGWTYLHKLTSGTWNGKKTPNPCDDGEMWECPDFFPLNHGHVLIYSTLGKVFWQSGRLDEATMRFHAIKTGELDLGAFYAPKTQLDAQGRRILWGWIQEHRTENEMRQAGWSGMMSLPRILTLDREGNLRMEVLPQTKSLRQSSIAPNVTAESRSATLPRATGEILCHGTAGSSFRFNLKAGDQAVLLAEYDGASHSVSVDGREIQLERTNSPVLHAFVDGSVVELLVAGRAGYTRRFYYPGNTAPDVTAVATGQNTMLEAWNLRPISSNRLTTPSR